MYQVYEIMDNDTFDSLAERLGTTVNELERINGANNFNTGDMIVIPKNNSLYYRYIVKSGDNLYNIARMYNQDVDVLYAINGIKEGDYIYPNQEILIPKENIATYITKEGDTLSNISRKTSTTINDLLKNNNALALMPGQLIIYERD